MKFDLKNEATHQLDAAGFRVVRLYIKLPITNYVTPLSLQRPLYRPELPFLASLSSPETCQYQLHTLLKVQRVQRPTKTHLRTLSRLLFCLWGIFNFSVLRAL